MAKAYDPLADKEYMSVRMKKYFRDLLESERQMAAEGLRTQGEAAEELSSSVAVSDEDWETRQEEEMLTEKIYARDFKLIAKIEGTIRRLDLGNFGYCNVESCGLEIGVERLMARPTASLCIECKEAQEWRERQGDRG